MVETLKHLQREYRQRLGNREGLAAEPEIEEGDATQRREALIDDAMRRDRDKATLRQIEHALDRWCAGEGHLCEECDRAIGEARLAAVPFASRCRECAERGEEKEDRVPRLWTTGDKEAYLKSAKYGHPNGIAGRDSGRGFEYWNDHYSLSGTKRYGKDAA